MQDRTGLGKVDESLDLSDASFQRAAEDLLVRLRGAPSSVEVVDILAGLHQENLEIRTFEGLRLRTGRVSLLEPEYKGLQVAHSLGISCAEKVREFIKVHPTWGILVSYIPGSIHAELQERHFGYRTPTMTEATKEGMRADVGKLQEAGLWNPALERFRCWYGSPSTEKAIVMPWRHLAPTSAEVIAEKAEVVLRMLDYA